MALTLSKLFMRTISQAPPENAAGLSLWSLADIERAQEKQRAAAALAADAVAPRDGDDEYDDGGIDDAMLEDFEMDGV
jgi:DNA excision repair protein ERCC-2